VSKKRRERKKATTSILNKNIPFESSCLKKFLVENKQRK
jgi:hypothetical protein